MGLIKAFINDVRGTMADQWIEYFNCDSIPQNVLLIKGAKYTTKNGQNIKSDDNVISDGARIDIADGQFMMIVENGKVVDYSAEPGQFIYKTDLQPSMLNGVFSNMGKVFNEIGKRFAGGGQPMSKQVVYYMNTKEIFANKWGIGEVPFRDKEFNFTIKIGAYGEYTYKILNPLVFYKNVTGNISGVFTKDKIDSQLRAELQTAMQVIIGKISVKEICYDQLPLYVHEICAELNNELSEKWRNLRGIEIVSLTMQAVVPNEESSNKIAEFQESRVYTDAGMMGAKIGSAQASAMNKAAENEAGAMTGFLGMGFAQQSGGAKAGELFEMQQQQKTAEATPEKPKMPVAGEQSWTCACGSVNKAKFCPECGIAKPTGFPAYQCDKCGWQPENPAKPPKFCPECGDPFNDEDKK